MDDPAEAHPDITAKAAVDALAMHADPADARGLARFFKTGPGEYGEGDVFIGVRVPATRRVARAFRTLDLDEVDLLLDSAVHEERLLGLFVLRLHFERARDDAGRRVVVDRYLAALARGRVNNWDLVDSSADPILGEWLVDRPRDLLASFVRDDDLWVRRVGIIATFAFIKRGDASTTLELAPVLLPDQHDLIRKAVGWMLREVGKRVDRALLVAFLEQHAAQMARTTLSYATEHLTPDERLYYRALR